MTETRRGVELRAEPGRRLVGTVMKYGAEARVMLPDGRAVVEKFAAFAFADYLRSGETRVNMMHDPAITIATTAGARGRGNLALIDKPDALRMVAVLPSGPAFDKALALVADGSTAETSVEFRAVSDRIENGRRTVLQSTLPGIGIVDAGAYGGAGAVEVRRRGGSVRARVPTRHKVACECAGDCSHAIFEPGSFEIPDEVLAVAGEYKAPVASLQRGTLKLAADDEALTIEIDLPDPSENEATRRLLEAAATVGVYARPYVDARLSEYTEDGDTRTYSRAWLRAIIVAPTDKVEGWEAAEVVEPRRAEPVTAGARFWL